MAALRLPLAYTRDGRRRDITAGPGEMIAYERRYKESFTRSAQDGLSIEALAYLCYAWEVNREGVVEPFDAWLASLDDLEPIAGDEDPTSPAATASSGS